ncbi:hypothetical protein GXP70_01040 [Paenibacillus lycopersici]|uniref:Uncharacterized protein n=1 Tax=Paenibacillus lycopersici TaxID=2704462 RepID=A0A6C0FTN3_9BACL|nr:hypothetical protein [Paenibacillus lycopersici]QHT58703.1 hypothetical protein GXP70_01040 [Paenibacillus lycopersici]
MASTPRAAAGTSALGGSTGEQAPRFSPAVRAITPTAVGAGTGPEGASAAPGLAEGGLPGGMGGNSAAAPVTGDDGSQAAAGPVQPAEQAQWNAASYKPETWFTRIGGMEGIMAGMSNAQKLYGMYKQIQPMVKWLNGLGGGATAAIQSVAKGAPRRRSGRGGKPSASGARRTVRAGMKNR